MQHVMVSETMLLEQFVLAQSDEARGDEEGAFAKYAELVDGAGSALPDSAPSTDDCALRLAPLPPVRSHDAPDPM
jgi:hypothetical protein